MFTKVQKWGNSQGIRLPKKLLEKTQIKVGEEVDISVKDGKIIVEATNNIRGKYSIAELAQNMPKDYKVSEEDWGLPVGKEVF